MANTRPYIDDTGTAFVVDVGSNIEDATLLSLDIQKPDNVTAVWDAELFETTKMKHTIASGDFDQKGKYFVQAQVTTPDGKWSGEIVSFFLFEKLVP